jgi:type I restriction enzyme S subunit
MKWDKLKLGDITDVRDGTHDSPDYHQEGYPLVTSKNIKNGRLDLTDVNYISETDYVDINKRSKVDMGDILMPMIGTIGNPVLVEVDPSFAIKNVCLIKQSNRVINRYIYYLLQSSLFEETLLNKSRGGTQKFLSLSDIRNFNIPLPPLHIQEQIADTLDKADALRRKDQELLQKYDELAQAVFYDMFGDPVKRNVDDALALSELCVLNPKKSEITLAEDAMVSFVPMEDVDEKGNVHAHKTREYKDVSTGFTYFREGDVLFAKITPCMENGKGGIACNLTNGVGFGSTEFHVIRPGSSLSSEFLSTLFSLKSVRKEAEKMMTGSAGQKRVPKTFFDAIKIGRINDQKVKSFDRAYQLVKSSRNGTQKCFSESSLLFKSLLSSFFS